MKLKRKVAALLAFAMVFTSQPTSVLANGLNTLTEGYEAAEENESEESKAEEVTDETEEKSEAANEEETAEDTSSEEESNVEESDAADETEDSKEDETETSEDESLTETDETETSDEAADETDETETSVSDESQEETAEAADETETAAEEETEADVEETKDAESYMVVYEVTPEEGAEVKGAEEVEAGDDLEFKVTPEDGWKLDSVFVNGEEITYEKTGKSVLFFFGDTYYEYKVTDVDDNLSVEINLKSEDLTASDGDIDVTVAEEDKDALKNVSEISVTDLGQDDTVEAAVSEKLEGKQIVDYKAVDITLYDEDGNETEPDGNVSVQIGGVGTDEEYDEVVIYHLKEKVMPAKNMAPAAMPMSIGLDDTEEESDVMLEAEEVTAGVKDDIEEEGVISFKADEFSTYVITFIKDIDDFTELNVNAVVYNPEGNNSNPTAIDIKGDVTFNIGADNASFNVTQIITGYDLAQLRSNGSVYVYSFATWGTDPSEENRISEDAAITYDDVKAHKENGIYLWYEDVTKQEVPVSISLDGSEQGGTYNIVAGDITPDKAQDAIESVEGTYAYVNAYIEPVGGETEDTKRAQIDSVKLLNGNYYVELTDSSGEVSYTSDDWKVVLYFESGVSIKMIISGTDSNHGNTVNGIIGNRDESNPYERQVSEGVGIQIPITIAQGYDLTVINQTTDEVIYTTENKNNDVRSYDITFDGNEISTDQEISIAFSKMDMVFDYTHYKENVVKGAGESQYHGATVTFNGKSFDTSANPAVTALDVNGYGEVIDNTMAIDYSGTDYILNALAINGQSVTVPQNPTREPSGNAGNGRTGSVTSDPAITTIYDMNGDPMATITVTATVNYNSRWTITWVGGEWYWNRTGTTYTIVFEDIKTNLKITDCNLVGSTWKEARFRTIGEGLTVNAEMSNGESLNDIHVGQAVYNPRVNLTFIPEFGYYVSSFGMDGTDLDFTDRFTSWQNTREYTGLNFNSDVHYLDVNSELIDFSFEYVTDDTNSNATTPGEGTFTLGLNDLMSSALDNVVPVSKDGMTFVGWNFDGDSKKAYYIPSAVGISREMIMSNTNNITYGQKGEASIKLYPVYLPADQVVTAGYSVKFYTNDNHYRTIDEGLEPRNVGSYLQKEYLKTVDSVNSVMTELENRGYVLDGSKGDVRIEITNDESKNVFRIYYKTKEVNVTFKVSGEHGDFGELGTEYKTIQTSGDTLVTPTAVSEKGYKVEWTPALPDKVPNKDTVYTAKFVEDPEEWATVTFTTDEHGNFTDQTNPYVVRLVKGSEFPVEPTPVDSTPGENGTWMFDKWEDEDGNPVVEFPETLDDNMEFTAVYAFDSADDEDEIPEIYEIEATFTVNHGTFADGENTTDTKTFARVDENGQWSETGSHTIVAGDIPEGMIPYKGYGPAGNGSWDPTLKVGTVVDDNNKSFTYTFGENAEEWATVTFTTDEHGNFTDQTNPYVVRLVKGSEFPVEPTPVDSTPGENGTWMFDKWEDEDGNPVVEFPETLDDNMEFTAVYAFDSADDEDEIPEIYEIEATFTVNHGTFADGENTTDTKTFARVDENGQWSETGSHTIVAGDIPEGMIPYKGYGPAGNGSWDPTLKVGTVVDDNNKSFTYTFTKDDTQWSTVIFDKGEHGSFPEGTVLNDDGKFETEVLINTIFTDISVPIPTPDKYWEFVGWTDATGNLINKDYAISTDCEFTAKYQPVNDENSDNIPDEYQVIVTYKIVNGAWSDGTVEDKTAYVTLYDMEGNLSEEGFGDAWAVSVRPIPGEPNEGYQANGSWSNNSFYVTKDSDEAARTFTFTFMTGWYGYTVEYYYDGVKGEATEENATIGSGSTGELNTTVTVTPASTVIYNNEKYMLTSTDHSVVIKPEGNVIVVQYSKDANNDNIPDDDQTPVNLSVYDTTIYTGGENSESGFPELELRYDEEGRQIINEAVTDVTINGHKYSDTDGEDISLDTFFKAVYWDREARKILTDDSVGGNYVAAVVLTNAAKDSIDGSTEGDDGLLLAPDADGTLRRVSADTVDIGVNAVYTDGMARSVQTESYIVNIDNGELVVRETQNEGDAVYRDVVANEADIVVGERASAVIPAVAKFYTNGSDEREVSRDGIKLLTDVLIHVDDGRQELILDKAFDAAYGVNSYDNYGYLVRYFDLVDSNNGNAWVESSEPTSVYIPYPEGTDRNTEFRLEHFVGLHREENLYGQEAIDAINACNPVEMQVTNTEYGIKFTTSGEHAFSPFVLMWKERSGNDGGSDSTPGAGPGASGSSYTAGVDGHWVHMSPDNIFEPLTVPVPEGATPVTNPEWHQWKFILNNGSMLYDQWAYVYNPYAVGDQPREGWFSFANNGIMEYGWYLDERTGKWYWMHRTSDGMLGTMLTGWHYDDQDGKWYYLSPETGEMLLGWQQIDGVWYYFNPYAPETTWVFDESTGGWTWNGSASRPYGSMYINEMTPDGYYVDENGAWRN